MGSNYSTQCSKRIEAVGSGFELARVSALTFSRNYPRKRSERSDVNSNSRPSEAKRNSLFAFKRSSFFCFAHLIYVYTFPRLPRSLMACVWKKIPGPTLLKDRSRNRRGGGTVYQQEDGPSTVATFPGNMNGGRTSCQIAVATKVSLSGHVALLVRFLLHGPCQNVSLIGCNIILH